MKKLISFSMCLVFLLLCGCSTVKSTVELKPKYSQTATVKMGEYSYSANVKFDGKTSVGNFTLTVNQSSELVSFNIPDADFSIEFDVNSK